MASPIWNKNVPQSSEFASNWPQESQQNLEYLEEALGLEHTFPGTIGPPQTAGVHRAASTTETGTARIATAAEVAAGSDNTLIVSPLGLQTGISGSGQTHYGRLKVFNNVGAPTTKIDITADAVILSDGGSPATPFRVVDVNVAIDYTVTGANGLDTGSLSTGWYYSYVIAKADGTVAGLGSTSATTPTLPTDYIYYRVVNAVYYYGTGSTFYQFYQYNRNYYYLNSYLAGVSKIPGAATLNGAWNSWNISTVIPALAVRFWGGGNDNVGNGRLELSWTVAGTSNYRQYLFFVDAAGGYLPFDYLLNPSDPQTLYAQTNASIYIVYGGFEIDI